MSMATVAIQMAAREYRTPESVRAVLREYEEDHSGSESETTVQGPSVQSISICV